MQKSKEMENKAASQERMVRGAAGVADEYRSKAYKENATKYRKLSKDYKKKAIKSIPKSAITFGERKIKSMISKGKSEKYKAVKEYVKSTHKNEGYSQKTSGRLQNYTSTDKRYTQKYQDAMLKNVNSKSSGYGATYNAYSGGSKTRHELPQYYKNPITGKVKKKKN